MFKMCKTCFITYVLFIFISLQGIATTKEGFKEKNNNNFLFYV